MNSRLCVGVRRNRYQPTRMVTMVHGAEGRFHELCTCHRVSPSSPFISRRVYRISSELRSQAASSFLSTGVGDHPGIGGNGDFIPFAFCRRSPLLLLVASLFLHLALPAVGPAVLCSDDSVSAKNQKFTAVSPIIRMIAAESLTWRALCRNLTVSRGTVA